jgi:hypothetical protein
MEQHLTEIQSAINEILNVKSLIRRKKKSQSDKKRELFLSIVNSIEQLINREHLMYADLQLDFSKYNEPFYDVIDALIILHFGKEGSELIGYFLYERVSPDGNINPLYDQNENEVILNDATDLWNLLVKMYPKYAE